MASAVTVIILNWNGGEDTLRCLESVRAQDHANVRTIVADNGSTDGSLEAVRERFPDVEVIENGSNLGYCEGNNRALERVVAEGGEGYALLLNNDAVLEPSAVREMAEALDRQPEVGIVGPRILMGEDEGRIWSAGGDLLVRQNVGRLRGKNEPDGPAFDRGGDVDFVTGCAMMVRADLLREIGLFDPVYFAYVEDVDLCVRAKNSGARVVYVPEARVHHSESSSTGGGYTKQRKYWMGRNAVLFLKRYGTMRQWGAFALFSIAALPVVLVREALRGNAGVVLAKAYGILHGFLGRRVSVEG